MPGEETITQPQATDQTTEQPVVKEGESKPEHMIPKSRFDEVNTRAKQYERLGTPEQLQASMDRLAYYTELERQAIEEAGKSKTGEATEETKQKMAEANKALFQVEPRLAKAIEAGDFKEAHEMRCRIVATDETAEIMREMGMEVTKEDVNRMGTHWRPYLDSDPVAHAEFFTDPRRAIRRIYKAWQKDVADQVERTTRAKQEQDKLPHNKLPRSPSPTGGSPPTGKAPPEPAGNMRDLERNVTAKLKNLEI